MAVNKLIFLHSWWSLIVIIKSTVSNWHECHRKCFLLSALRYGQTVYWFNVMFVKDDNKRRLRFTTKSTHFDCIWIPSKLCNNSTKMWFPIKIDTTEHDFIPFAMHHPSIGTVHSITFLDIVSILISLSGIILRVKVKRFYYIRSHEVRILRDKKHFNLLVIRIFFFLSMRVYVFYVCTSIIYRPYPEAWMVDEKILLS